MLSTNSMKIPKIRAARTYFSRWKIEVYFRCKKQVFQFKNFRVRKLRAINALNFYITLRMSFLSMISIQPETNALTDWCFRSTYSFFDYSLRKLKKKWSLNPLELILLLTFHISPTLLQQLGV